MADLLDWEAQPSASEYYDEAEQERPLLMRHSQGDQRDLLVNFSNNAVWKSKYLVSTGQTPNMIFHREAGSDVDVFTIGFHPDLQTFAAPADVTIEEKELAAKAAGFKSLSDISFYLRSALTFA